MEHVADRVLIALRDKLIEESEARRTAGNLVYGFGLQAWQHRNTVEVANYLSMIDELIEEGYGGPHRM